ncbi:MAG: hypothetical protein BGO95_03385 [Micrococcales bacterium 73-13]|nr:MAG: hypothetical protein BGO95_03385 [Micrococcales bacterium 73-13]
MRRARSPRLARLVRTAIVTTLLATAAPTGTAVPAEAATAAAEGRDLRHGSSDSLPWLWPVESPRRLLRPYSAPPRPWMPGHRGIDIAATGTVVLAPADGVVHFAGWVVDRGVLSIDHGAGVRSSFEPVTTGLSAGDAVVRGQAIATIVPGHCDLLCLHVGVRQDGEYRNPLLWLGGARWPVLLPMQAVG